MFLDKIKAEEKINSLGKEGKDFVFLINYQMDKCLICHPTQAKSLGLFYHFNGHSNWDFSQTNQQPNLPQPIFIPPSLEKYSNCFSKVMSQIQAGNTYLINLCFRSKITNIVNFDDIMNHSTAQYKFLFQDQFISFSPETFVKIENGIIFTHPMKGTISAENNLAKTQLMQDQKELAEHYTIVDLLRNDLSISANNVEVQKFRYLSKIQFGTRSLYQTSSEISGILPRDYQSHLGTILFNMLPAGSITGAPKLKTVKILKEVETFERGFYTGIAGIYSNGNLDSCVLIRFIEKEGENFYYKSGGGITFMSNVTDEYQELIEKIYVPFT